MSFSLAKTLKLVLLSSVMALGAARDADAAFVVINADPVYGAQFPSLSWRAVGALYIPNGCLTVGQIANSFVNPLTVNFGEIDPFCGSSRIQDVQLQFYETSTNTVIETLGIPNYTADNGAPNFDRDLLIGELISVTLRDGQLDGFSTTLSTPVHFTQVGGGNYCFALEFSSATARVESLNYDATSGQCADAVNPRPPEDATNLATRAVVTWDGSFTGGTVNQAPTFTPLPVIVRNVPEPTSLALALAALAASLAAGSFARRSRG